MVPVSNLSHASSDLFLIAFMSMYKAEQIQFGNVIPKGNLINKTLKVHQESERVILCELTAALSHKQPHRKNNVFYSVVWENGWISSISVLYGGCYTALNCPKQ